MPIESSFGSFKKSVDKFAEKFQVQVQQVVAKTAIDIFSGIVRDTPVDEGRARASWQLTKNAVDPSVAPEDAAPYDVPNAVILGSRLLPLEEGEIIYISNNLEYIVPLEEGHSKKAPAGMVARNVARFKNAIEAAVRNVD